MSETRGQPKKRKIEDIQEVVLSHKSSVILESGKICSKSSDIWQTSSGELLSKKNATIPASSLHSYVVCNTDGIKHLSMPDLIIEKRDEVIDRSVNKNNVSLNSEDSIDQSFTEVEIHFSKNEFDALITKKQYKNKRGQKNVVRKAYREYAVLESGKWQIELSKKLYQKLRISCGFNYANHKIYLTTARGTFSGKCNCRGTISGEFSGKSN